MIFSKFKELYHHHHNPVWIMEHFQKDASCPFTVNPHSHPYPQATINLLEETMHPLSKGAYPFPITTTSNPLLNLSSSAFTWPRYWGPAQNFI